MILSCLSERDMYGLELIDEIKERYGREIKLPSLYSNINRMKELKYISSYLKESTKGPKCSYSSITEIGRNALEELKAEFDGVDMSQPKEEEKAPTIEVSLQTNAFESALTAAYISPASTEMDETEEEFETPDDYDDYFSFDDEEAETNKAEEIEELKEEEDSPVFMIQQKISDSDFEEEAPAAEEIEDAIEEEAEEIAETEEEIEEVAAEDPQEEQEEVKEEKVVVNTQEAQEYNQKVYAAAKDFSKNKNKRSYSENQIELALSTSPARSEEATKQDLDELKSALLSSRQGYYEEVKVQPVLSAPVEAVPVMREPVMPQEPAPAPVTPAAPIAPVAPVAQAAEPVKEERRDDGRFITEVLSEKDIPKPKRIEPARLNLTLPNTNTDKRLPAPKRNIAVDPTCSDVKAKLEKLYAKAEVVKKEVPVYESNDFEDYSDLKRYYLSQEVDFKVYERPEKRPKHNTNRLKLFVSLFIFGLVGVGSALMYLIFSLCGLTQAATNFVYYLFPILAAVYVVYNYYTYKTTASKVPNKMWHPAIVWTIFAALIAIIFLVNYVCGVPFTELNSYFSTIIVPVFAAGCFTIGLYYAQLVAYKKWWK